MEQRPLLLFPEPAKPSKRANRGPFWDRPERPDVPRQAERLRPLFATLTEALQTQRLQLQAVLPSAEPALVLVFETRSSVDRFVTAVQHIEGLEWLAASDMFDAEPDDDFYYEEDPDRQVQGYLYLVASNSRGLDELRSLWDEWVEHGEDPGFKFPRNLGAWREAFMWLSDIRPWGPQDRVRETGLEEVWRERVEAEEEDVPVEIELWFMGHPSARKSAEAAVRAYIKEEKGAVTGQGCEIPEIEYHALPATLPAAVVEQVLRGTAKVVQAGQVMLVRPAGQVCIPLLAEGGTSPPPRSAPEERPTGGPFAALLDGLPLENHEWLQGRLIIDDPDEWATDYPAGERVHGTAMASLICHGDLSSDLLPIDSPLYVRPVLRPARWPYGSYEEIPAGVLAVDLVHRAVRRMFEPPKGEEPVAPSVKVINLSVADRWRPLDLRLSLSPWARLLDWLSWRHGVLFIVSAGNCVSNLELAVPPAEYPALRAETTRLRGQVTDALQRESFLRRIISPAEAINALTVGALQADESALPPLPDAVVDPITSPHLPSPVTRMGPGFRRGLKPDVCAPGGRQLYRASVGTRARATLEPSVPASRREPGQLAAAPGQPPARATSYSRGTSNATALTTRSAVRFLDALDELRAQPGGDRLGPQHESVLVKALLVHSASWDGADQLLDGAHLDWLRRFMGYGAVPSEPATSCNAARVTLLGWGDLAGDEAHTHALPLPHALRASREWRRLTVTLAWLTPVCPGNQKYRAAHLWFTPYGEDRTLDHKALLGIRRIGGRNYDQVVQRGTVQHEIFEGQRATAFGEGEPLHIKVNCRADAVGRLDAPVPYGLVVSLTVRPELGIDIYTEVAERVQQRIPIRPVTG